MNQHNRWFCQSVGVLVWLSVVSHGQEPQADTSHTIFGMVVELRSGTADVPVCLCDGTTGMPLAKETYQPVAWGQEQPDQTVERLAIVVTDEKGRFRFEGVPDGKYRLVAQQWTGPYKGLFAEHGTVIQLMGTANDVIVPRPDDYYKAMVPLTPPGKAIVQFDQEVGNSDTIMFLSTAPPEFDPALGLAAMGSSFFTELVGLNRMPLGRTTVIGVPNEPLHAYFFAPDNSPGFAAVEVPPSATGLAIVPAEPFVAGWSDGRKTPPPELAKLGALIAEHSLTCDQLLNIPELSAANYEAYRDRQKELQSELANIVKIADGHSARVGDILAVKRYEQLNR